MRKRAIPAVIILLVVAAILFYYFAGSEAGNSNRADGVVDAPVFSAGAEVAGTVVELKFEEGEIVEKGDLIAVLENDFYEQQKKVAEKKADVIRAQIEALDDNDEVLTAQLEQAEEEIKLYQAYIDALEIRATHSGVLETWLVDIGQVVSPGQKLAQLVDPEKPFVSAFVTQNQLDEIKVGKKVKVRVDALPEQEFEGQIVWISPEAEFTPKNVLTREERAELVYRIKVEFTQEPEGVLPGMTAEVTW